MSLRDRLKVVSVLMEAKIDPVIKARAVRFAILDEE
jgi:hypothetical protein